MAGPVHPILEGTLIDTVLTNRLDGSSASPVNCLVTNPVYSHSGQHVVIPAGARILGETKPVQTFGEARLAVVFHRLVMPDGRTHSLDQFLGLNQVGDAGLRDRVNQHYWSRGDLHSRKAWRQRETAAQIASHEHKRRAIADWIQRYGTPQQQARHAAGVLPIEEAIEAMTEQAFVAGDAFERYSLDGARCLQERLRHLPKYAAVVINPTDINIFGTDAVKATEAQWSLVQQLQQVFPDATVTLREHRIAWRGDPHASTLTRYGVIVTRKVGLFDLRREYAAPDT